LLSFSQLFTVFYGVWNIFTHRSLIQCFQPDSEIVPRQEQPTWEATKLQRIWVLSLIS
jgi:hypothetical protein